MSKPLRPGQRSAQETQTHTHARMEEATLQLLMHADFIRKRRRLWCPLLSGSRKLILEEPQQNVRLDLQVSTEVLWGLQNTLKVQVT